MGRNKDRRSDRKKYSVLEERIIQILLIEHCVDPYDAATLRKIQLELLAFEASLGLSMTGRNSFAAKKEPQQTPWRKLNQVWRANP